MKIKKITAHFYATPGGREPVKELILSLNKADRKIIGEDIKICEFGWPMGLPVCRPLGKGLFEVRGVLSRNRNIRVFFCVLGERMILLHAIIKKTQRTPADDLALARKRMEDFRRIL